MARIAITGISGFLGQRVHEQLRDDGHDVIGVDIRPPRESRDLIFREADVRSRPDLDRAFADVAGVVHLAASPGTGEPDRSVDVGGSMAVFDAAAAAGVDLIVALSSAMVYGAHADNPIPMDESAPLKASHDFPMAAHKLQVEAHLAGLNGPDAPRIVILRPAMIVGADTDNFLSRALQGTRLLAIRGHHPPSQFVHVDDVASAVALAVRDDRLEGAYNVACEGWLSFDEVRAILDRRVIEVPEVLAFTATHRGHRLGLSPLPASGLPWVMHPWVVSSQKLVAEGWQPSLTNRDAAALLATERADRINLAGYETDRRTVRRSAGVVAASLAGGVLALGLLARRRHDEPAPADADDL